MKIWLCGCVYWLELSILSRHCTTKQKKPIKQPTQRRVQEENRSFSDPAPTCSHSDTLIFMFISIWGISHPGFEPCVCVYTVVGVVDPEPGVIWQLHALLFFFKYLSQSYNLFEASVRRCTSHTHTHTSEISSICLLVFLLIYHQIILVLVAQWCTGDYWHLKMCACMGLLWALRVPPIIHWHAG